LDEAKVRRLGEVAGVMGSFDRHLSARGDWDKLHWVAGGHEGMACSRADVLAA